MLATTEVKLCSSEKKKANRNTYDNSSIKRVTAKKCTKKKKCTAREKCFFFFVFCFFFGGGGG